MKPRIKDPDDYYQGLDIPERIITRNALLFERYHKESLRKFELASSMHHRYLLLRIIETPGIVNVDGNTHRLNEGDCLLLSPFQFHSYIHCDHEHIGWNFITFELNQGQQWTRILNDRPIPLTTRTTAYWDDIIKLWISADDSAKKELLPSLDRLLTSLCSEVNDAKPLATTISTQDQSHHSQWLAQIEGLIIESVSKGWTLEQVAERAHISYRYLCKRFGKAMGISLSEYRANYQYHKALSLLQNSQMALSEIAELSGFNSPSAFSRFIKQMSGISPLQLRRQLKATYKK